MRARILLTKATTLLLVICILACPIICRGELLGSAHGCCSCVGVNSARAASVRNDESKLPACCAARAQGSDLADVAATALPSEEPPPAPRPGQPQRNASGCLCAGAVLEKKETHKPSVEQSLDLVTVMLALPGSALIDRSVSALASARGGDRATPGRLLCSLHMLLLC